MAQGLCDRCAEKWSYGHKCGPSVQLHAIHELWDLLREQEVSDGPIYDSVEESAHLYVCLSEATVTRVEAPRSETDGANTRS
jgi:hypothetical protein